jgi:hypothetical protein
MTIQYTWKINQLERNPSTGVVKTVYWDCLGVDEETENFVHMHCSYYPSSIDPDDPNFIPFNELSEQTILEWVWQGPTKEQYETSVAEQIELKNNPPIVTGVPWQDESI